MPSIINSDDGVVSGTSGLKTTGGNDGLLNIQTNGSTAMSINASQQVTFNNGVTMPNTFGFENRIINGGMTIDQRNGGSSITPTSTVADTYSLDRWCTYGSAASKFSVQQSAGSVTPPAGFRNYLGITSLAATSVGSSDQYYLAQYIEGFNIFDLMFGSASASTVTLSFWVRSSLTGTFGGSLTNSAINRSYPFSYTISAADTWEQKTVTVSGDTSGTWLTVNNVGLRVHFGLGVGTSLSGTAGAWAGSTFISATGATSVVGTNGATFYITGVQLEVGSTATSFDFRSYGTELALCQRYFQRIGTYARQNGGAISASGVIVPIPIPVTMRATPTFSGSISQMKLYNGGSVTISSITYAVNAAYDAQIDMQFGGISVSDNNTYWVSFNASSLSAEL